MIEHIAGRNADFGPPLFSGVQGITACVTRAGPGRVEDMAHTTFPVSLAVL